MHLHRHDCVLCGHTSNPAAVTTAEPFVWKEFHHQVCVRQVCTSTDTAVSEQDYRGTSLTRPRPPLGPYRRPMPRVLGGSYGGGHSSRTEGVMLTLHVVNQASFPCQTWPPCTPPTQTRLQFSRFCRDTLYMDRGASCDPKGSMAFLQKNFRCPPMLGAQRT